MAGTLESLLQHIVPGGAVTAEGIASAQFDANMRNIRGRLAAAPPGESWRVALEIVDVERWTQQAESMVVPPLMMPGMVSTGAGMVATYVEVLCELDQRIRTQHAGAQEYKDSEDARPASMETALAQLQREMGLLRTLQGIFGRAAQQRLVAEQPGGSSCALGHGPECPATIAGRALVPSAIEAMGAGPPCRSCLLAHAQLLAACSTLLRFWPECVLGKERAAWAWAEAAAECALHMLQDVSTAVLQHQQPHADGLGGLLQQRQAAPPADVVQAGIAALDMLATVCGAAASARHADVCRRNMVPQLCDRDMLDSSCMLTSMLAVGAAAVLGQEMQRRLYRTSPAATCAGSGASSVAAGATCGSSGGIHAPDAAVPKDQAGQHGTAAACSHSMQGSSKGADAPGVGLGAADAVWRLVCVTEEWSGGQLLPQPFMLLLESLGCHPKAFLLLACSWQQQHAGSGSQQPQPKQRSNDQNNTEGFIRLMQAYHNAFYLERRYITQDDFPQASVTLLQRLSDCHTKGQHKHGTQRHLLLAMLLMRDAIRGSFRGMFNPATSSAAAAGLSVRPECTASLATDCVSTWLCWAQFSRQKQQEAQQEQPAAASGAAAAPNQPAACSQEWALGGAASTAVLLEVLQGQCRLLREGVRELQAVTSSWAATRSSGDHSSSSSSSGDSSAEKAVDPGFELSHVDNRVISRLNSVRGLLHAVVAAAAVDSGVLQQAAPHLFRLAGTLEQLVRLRCACHSDRLVLGIDWGLLQLLQLMLGSLDLSAYAELREDGPARQPSASAAAPRAQRLVKACGLLSFAAVFVPSSSKQQRQLLGLLFSSLKLFSTYPAGLYAVSFVLDHQDNWLAAACDTIRAVCAAGRLLLVAGGPLDRSLAGGWGAQDQQQHKGSTPQGVAGGQRSSAPATLRHSCGLGADGMGALLPWVGLQGRALQLWVALFRVYVQLPPAAEAGKAARSSKAQEVIYAQPHNLVGSAEALNLLAVVFEEAVAPSTQLLAVVLQGAAYRCEQPLQRQSLSNSALVSELQTILKQAMATGRLLYGVPSCLWPPTSLKKVAEGGWLQQQLVKHGQQLRSHCRDQGLDLSHLEPASGSAAATVLQVLRTLVATSEGLKQLGDSADTQYRLRQSDVRRYLKSWEVTDAAVLKGVLAMLSGGEHSAAGVAVAAWLCSPSIAGDLLAQLQEFSSQLSTLPIHEACNNPACWVMTGSSEQGLVSGKACVCAGCRMGHYCGETCQREHWPLHQRQCGGAVGKREH